MVVVAAGPDWATAMTAVGTVAVAVVAVGVALFTEWRISTRVREERTIAAAALADERAHSAMQLADERAVAQRREQLAEAYAVQVVMGERPGGDMTGDPYEPVDDSVKVLRTMIVNHGKYTISQIQARFCTDGKNVVPPRSFARLGGFDRLPDRLRHGFTRLEDDSGCGDVLAPGDIGMRFDSDGVAAQHLAGPYPIVRWTDQWGTHWEHKRGDVRQMHGQEPWTP